MLEDEGNIPRSLRTQCCLRPGGRTRWTEWHQCTQDRSCLWWDGWSTAACPARAQDVSQAPRTQPRPRSCAPLPTAEARTPSPGRCTRAWSSSRLTGSSCCLELMPLPVRFSLRRLRDETSGKQDHPHLQTS